MLRELQKRQVLNNKLQTKFTFSHHVASAHTQSLSPDKAQRSSALEHKVRHSARGPLAEWGGVRGGYRYTSKHMALRTTHYTQAAIAGTWACVQKGLHKYVMYNKDDDPSMQSLWATPTKRNARVETLQWGKAAQTYNLTNRHHQLPPCYGYRALFLDLTTCTEFGSWNKAKLGHCVRNMRLGLRFHHQLVMQTKRSENTRVLFLRLDELVSKV